MNDNEAMVAMKAVTVALKDERGLLAEQFVLPGLRQFVGMMAHAGVEPDLLAAALRQVAMETAPTQGNA